MRRKVAVKLGVQLRELEEIARRLAEVGLIDPETLQPVGWDKEQFVSDTDPNATERKRKWRADQRKKKQVLSAVTDRVTRDPPVTGSVTAPKVTRTDTEQKQITETTTASDIAEIVGRITWDDLPHFSVAEQYEFAELIQGASKCVQQDLADELAGAIRKGVIKGSWQAWMRGIIKRFSPNYCREIQKDRCRSIHRRSDALAGTESRYENEIRYARQRFDRGEISEEEHREARIEIDRKHQKSRHLSGVLQ